MKGNQAQIGFSQKISLEWLEQTANHVLAGMSSPEISESLEDMLKSRVSVGNNPKRGNRQKAITILRRIWCERGDNCHQLRQRGLELLRQTPRNSHIICHWGMTMAVYPFVGVVAETVGRLLQLQAAAPASQIQRRLRERYGERETVARAARRVLRCFIDWGTLKEAEKKGIYRPAPPIRVDDYGASAWLVEAVVHAQPNQRCTLSNALGSPALFPFIMQSMSCETLLSHAKRLEAVHRGFGADLIVIRR